MKTEMIVVFASLMAMPAFAQQNFSEIKYHDGTTQLTINAEEGTAEIDQTCGTTTISGWNTDGNVMKAYEKGGLPTTNPPTEITAHARQSGQDIIVMLRGQSQMDFTPGPAPAHPVCEIRAAAAAPQAIEQAGANNDIMINATSWVNASGAFPALDIAGKTARISLGCGNISIENFHADGEPMVGEQSSAMVIAPPRPAPTKVTVTARQIDGRMDLTIGGTSYSLKPGQGGGTVCE